MFDSRGLLRAFSLMAFFGLTACGGGGGGEAEAPLTLSGRVTAAMTLSQSDVLGSWSAIRDTDGMVMGVLLNRDGSLISRAALTDEAGTPVPAGQARWRLVNDVLIIKWAGEAGQDECVQVADSAVLSLRCQTIGGGADGEVARYDLDPVALSSDLPGTSWYNGGVVVSFTSGSTYDIYAGDEAYSGSWSAAGLRLTLNGLARCDFAGWASADHTIMFLACGERSADEFLAVWARSGGSSGSAGEGTTPEPVPGLSDPDAPTLEPIEPESPPPAGASTPLQDLISQLMAP